MELGEWTPHRMKLRPESFKFSSFDVAIGGVGWVGVAADGDVRLQVCVCVASRFLSVHSYKCRGPWLAAQEERSTQGPSGCAPTSFPSPPHPTLFASLLPSSAAHGTLE